MRSLWRIAQIMATAAVLMTFAASVSSAEDFDVVSEFYRLQWPSFTFETSAGRVVCPLTLEGSFTTASFAPTARTRVATVTRAALGTCSENRGTILSETLPWSLQYSSFGGTLPNITSLTFRLIGASFRGTIAGVTCLTRSTEERPINFTATRETFGRITGTRLDERAGISLTGALCELVGEAHASGTGELRSRPTEEGEGEFVFFFLNRQGIDLVNGTAPPVENTLRDVTLAREASATLVMTDRNPDYRVRLSTVTIVNPERYELLNPAERCEAAVVLTRGRARICNIQIRRRNETLAAQNSRVRITYSYPFERFAGLLRYQQEFNVIAS